jgi:carbon monoxide dehydrogenase subunit G
VVVDIARSPDTCWRALTDAAQFAAWMPGLRSAVVLAEDAGLPREVHFEFSSKLSYTLAYTYDVVHREVHWEPRSDARSAVRGTARLEPHGDGTRLTYKLEQGAGRTVGDLVIGGAPSIVGAFVRWVESR